MVFKCVFCLDLSGYVYLHLVLHEHHDIVTISQITAYLLLRFRHFEYLNEWVLSWALQELQSSVIDGSVHLGQ